MQRIPIFSGALIEQKSITSGSWKTCHYREQGYWDGHGHGCRVWQSVAHICFQVCQLLQHRDWFRHLPAECTAPLGHITFTHAAPRKLQTCTTLAPCLPVRGTRPLSGLDRALAGLDSLLSLVVFSRASLLHRLVKRTEHWGTERKKTGNPCPRGLVGF